MANPAITESDRTVEAELTGLSWALAQRFYMHWRQLPGSGRTGVLWSELPSAVQESLAEAFQHMLSEDVIEVGASL